MTQKSDDFLVIIIYLLQVITGKSWQ